jgi:hypothetical protein
VFMPEIQPGAADAVKSRCRRFDAGGSGRVRPR